jgi:hypothetical protein
VDRPARKTNGGRRLGESASIIDRLRGWGMHMSNQASMLAEAGAGEDDYDALHAFLSSTARGRAFLAQHARRTRHADVEALLGTLERLEGGLAPQAPSPRDTIEERLEELSKRVESLCEAQPKFDLAGLANNIGRLTELIETLHGQLQGKAQTPAPAQPAVSTPPSLSATAAPTSLALSAVVAQALAGAAEEPELRVFKAGSIPPPVRFAGFDFSSDEPAEAAPARSEMPAASRSPYLPDPLAPILALSEEERLALFA